MGTASGVHLRTGRRGIVLEARGQRDLSILTQGGSEEHTLLSFAAGTVGGSEGAQNHVVTVVVVVMSSSSSSSRRRHVVVVMPSCLTLSFRYRGRRRRCQRSPHRNHCCCSR